jgi:peroxiredoxin
MSRFAAVALAAALTVGPVAAGEFNKVLNVGDAAPKFEKLKNTVDGKLVSSSDFKKDIQVIVVTCNHCPVAEAYEERVIEFTKKYKDKVDVVAICVSLLEPDAPDKMTERAKERGFNFPYLSDESQAIGRALGASVTPDFYVVHKGKVAYMGAMDNSFVPKKVTKKYLEEAVDALLKGDKPPLAETAPIGCAIEYKKAEQ